MSFCSTKGAKNVNLETAILTGYAPDGGLVMPSLPLPVLNTNFGKATHYKDIIFCVLDLFLVKNGNIKGLTPENLKTIINDAFSDFSHDDVVPMLPVNGGYIMELFHGPTLAFKDIGLQIVGAIFDFILERRIKEGEAHTKMNVIVSTSGDTGSAALACCKNKKNVNIFVLFPHPNRISDIQRKQMTTLSNDHENMIAIGVDGTSDEIDVPVMKILKEDSSMSNINSINILRIIAQIAHFVHGFLFASRSSLTLPESESCPRVRFFIPNGASGNLVSAVIAKALLGEKGKGIVLVPVCNSNDVLSKFILSSRAPFLFRPKQEGAIKTVSCSMDIQMGYNVIRLLFLMFGGDAKKTTDKTDALENKSIGQFTVTKEEFSSLLSLLGSGDAAYPRKERAYAVTDEQTKHEIARVYKEHGILLDPHTGVAFFAFSSSFASSNSFVNIVVATAHPGKFEQTVASSFEDGIYPETLPESVQNVMQKKEDFIVFEKKDQAQWEQMLIALIRKHNQK